MKKLKLFILAFTLFAWNVSAIEIDPVNPILPTEQLRAEIIDYIGKRCPYEYDKDECKASVLFKINSDNEIEVLKVISINPLAEPYLTKKLNHKKVNKPAHDVGQIYILPIRIIKES